jgi:Protein of unknown function (DUF2815)
MSNPTCLTPKARASYVYVVRPNKPMQSDQKAKYSLTLLFDATSDLTALRKLAKDAAILKFGADPTKWPANLRNPFRDQKEKDKEGYVPGCVFITATSESRPGLVDHALQDIVEEKDFYSGCYCRAEVTAFGYDVKGNKGVAFGLNHIQKLTDGPPLSGRGTPQDAFDAVEGAPAASTGSSPASIFG